MIGTIIGLVFGVLINAISWRKGWFTEGAFIAAGLLLGLWVVNFFVMSTGFWNAGGFMDCWPNCSKAQENAGAIFFYFPILMFVELFIGMSAFVWKRLRALL